MQAEFRYRQKHCHKQVVSSDGIAGALEDVVVLGVMLVARMWVLELKCGDDHPVGVVFL